MNHDGTMNTTYELTSPAVITVVAVVTIVLAVVSFLCPSFVFVATLR